MTKKIVEHNAQTNKVITREMSAEELSNFKIMINDYVEEQLEREKKNEEKQAKKESAKAKLIALGLDEAEVQAILGL